MIHFDFMRPLEKAPIPRANKETIALVSQPDLRKIIEKAQVEYKYWDKIKYLKIPDDYTPEQVWSAVRLQRKLSERLLSFAGRTFTFTVMPSMQQQLHELDMNYGGSLGASDLVKPELRNKYLISSVMEEAIRSSQIEGASTTRRVAKEMLSQKRSPRNKAEQMIENNFKTIEFMRQLTKQPLSISSIIEIQAGMTFRTMENAVDSGRFRTSDDIVVIDESDQEIMHRPPAFSELDEIMKEFVRFCNDESKHEFIHPVVKASIIHFLIGYIHPFADGNGRTARALFYWYLLRKGYWLMEYLSISAVILKSKNQYELAYLYTEIDELDVSYFIQYSLNTLRLAYEGLREYIGRKQVEQRRASELLKQGGLNERQAMIVHWFEQEPDRIITAKEIETYFAISDQSARNDLNSLVKKKLIKQRFIDGKKRVFFGG